MDSSCRSADLQAEHSSRTLNRDDWQVGQKCKREEGSGKPPALAQALGRFRRLFDQPGEPVAKKLRRRSVVCRFQPLPARINAGQKRGLAVVRLQDGGRQSPEGREDVERPFDARAQCARRGRVGEVIGKPQILGGQIDDRRQPCAPLPQQSFGLSRCLCIADDHSVERFAGIPGKRTGPIARQQTTGDPVNQQTRSIAFCVRQAGWKRGEYRGAVHATLDRGPDESLASADV
jgi:hypothetical protein